jgi:hypothetical protein
MLETNCSDVQTVQDNKGGTGYGHRQQPCSCKTFSYILQDRPEDRDLVVIVSVNYHSKQHFKHM